MSSENNSQFSILLSPYIREVVDFILFGSFFMAFCTVALLYTTYFYAGIDIRPDRLSLFVFAATLFQYNVHRLITTRKHPEDGHPTVAWSKRHPFILTMLCLASGGAAAILFFPLERSVMNALLPLLIMSILYELPIINLDGKRTKLRNLWFFKTILLVLTWTFVTVLLPYLQYDLNIYTTDFVLLFAKRLLLILALAIVFDIRDFDYDRADGVRTVPVLLGIMRSRRIVLATFVMIGLVGIAQVIFSGTLPLPYLAPMVVFPILSYYIVYQSIRYPTDYFYSFFVDGILALELALLLTMRFVIS